MPRHFVRGRGRGTRRPTDWSASAVASALTSLAANTIVLSETFTPIVGGETLIRTRGLFSWRSDQQAADEALLGAVGIAVVTAQAVSVGITAIPHPDTDSAWGGWLWHSYFSSSLSLGTSVGFDANDMQRIWIDSKAMRKVDEDERLVVVVENSSSFGMQFNTSERLLSKIH